MRKDKGLNGDLDRLPMLTWIMFLKFLDDLELQREQEATLAGKRFRRRSSRPTAGGTGPPTRRNHRRRVARLHQPGGMHPARRQARPGLFAYLRV